MATWATPIVAGMDLHDLSLANMLLAAAKERELVYHGTSASMPAVVVTGDNIQKTSFWFAIQQVIDTIRGGSHPWIDHRITVEGNATEDPTTFYWTYPAIRVAAGLPTTLAYSFNGTTQTATPASNNFGPRRQRPREILSAAATLDIQGNPAIAGQRAYLVGDGPIPAGASVTPNAGTATAAFGSLGKQYRCVASGNWVRDNTPVDMLDNTLASPNTIAETNTYFPTAAGEILYGDYLGAHIYEELRATMDLMRWTMVYTHNDIANIRTNAPLLKTDPGITNSSGYIWVFAHNDRKGEGGTDTVLANARANCSAAWSADDTPLGFGVYMPYALYQTGTSGAFYFCDAYRADATLQIVFPNAATIARKHSWFNYAKTLNDGRGNTQYLYDDNGDPILNSQWHSWYSAGPTSATSANLGILGAGLTLPNQSPAPTAPNDLYEQGYGVTGILGVMKWNTTGGFVYCTVTV